MIASQGLGIEESVKADRRWRCMRAQGSSGEPSKEDHLIDLLCASLIVKSPYALLSRVPFKFVRDFIRDVHKFHFI